MSVQSDALTSDSLTPDSFSGFRGRSIYEESGIVQKAAFASAAGGREEGYELGALRWRLLAAHGPLWGGPWVADEADWADLARPSQRYGGVTRLAADRFASDTTPPFGNDDGTIDREARTYWKSAIANLHARGATLAQVQATPNLARYMAEFPELAAVTVDVLSKRGAAVRTPAEWIAAYFLARGGVPDPPGRRTLPPPQLGTTKWNEAYARFFAMLGGNRTRVSFSNSLKNARDVFDAHLAVSGRVGWRQADRSRSPAPLPRLAQEVLLQWKDRSDAELFEQVSDLLERVEEVVDVAVPIVSAASPAFELKAGAFEFQTPPERTETVDGSAGSESIAGGPRRTARSARRAREIGEQGELLVERHLRSTLGPLGASVEYLVPIGLTPGYDIRYIDTDGNVVGVEVKSTVARRMTAFEITANERRAAEAMGERYFLALVTGVGSSGPEVHLLQNPAADLDFGQLRAVPASWVVSGFSSGTS